MADKIRVGLIGANLDPEKSWGMRARTRLKLSIMDRTRILRPSNSWSDKKSIDQHSLGADAAVRSSRSFAFTFRLGVLLRNCRPISR